MMLTVLGNFALPQSRNNAGRIPVLIGNGPGWLHEAIGRRGVRSVQIDRHGNCPEQCGKRSGQATAFLDAHGNAGDAGGLARPALPGPSRREGSLARLALSLIFCASPMAASAVPPIIPGELFSINGAVAHSDACQKRQYPRQHPGLDYGLIIEVRQMAEECHLGIGPHSALAPNLAAR